MYIIKFLVEYRIVMSFWTDWAKFGSKRSKMRHNCTKTVIFTPKLKKNTHNKVIKTVLSIKFKLSSNYVTEFFESL